MGVTIHKLLRNTAVLLLIVSLPGFLPAADLVRVRSSSPAEENAPVKGEEVQSDAEHATLAKRLRHPRSRLKIRHLALSPRFGLLPVDSKPGLSNGPTFTRHTDIFAEQLSPLRC